MCQCVCVAGLMWFCSLIVEILHLHLYDLFIHSFTHVCLLSDDPIWFLELIKSRSARVYWLFWWLQRKSGCVASYYVQSFQRSWYAFDVKEQFPQKDVHRICKDFLSQMDRDILSVWVSTVQQCCWIKAKGRGAFLTGRGSFFCF